MWSNNVTYPQCLGQAALPVFCDGGGGTAPASAMPITRTVYCHSQQADTLYIGDFWGKLKAEGEKLQFINI